MSDDGDWPTRALEELASEEKGAITDGPFGSNLKSSDYVERGAARVIRLGNIGVGEFVDTDRAFISHEKFKGLAKHSALPGDLVIAALADPVGRAAIVPDGIGPAVVKADCVRFRPGKEVDRRWLLHFLNSPQGLKQTEEAAHGIGRLRVNVGEIRALRIPAPSVAEQRQVVAMVDALRARSRRAKDALDTATALLDRLRQSILAAAFRGDLTADWREANPDVEPASELLKRIRIERRRLWEEAELAKLIAKGKAPKNDHWKSKYVEPGPVDDTDLPELPDGWRWSTLGELSTVVGDSFLRQGWSPQCLSHAAAPGEWGVMKTTAIQPLEFRAEENKALPSTLEPRPELQVEVGDLIITRAGPRARVGIACAVRRTAPRVMLCDKVYALRLAAPGLEHVVAGWMNTPHGAAHIEQMKTGSSDNGMNLTQPKLMAMPVPVPHAAEMHVLVARLDAALAAVAELAEHASNAEGSMMRLESSFLAAAFRGELLDRHSLDSATDPSSPA